MTQEKLPHRKELCLQSEAHKCFCGLDKIPIKKAEINCLEHRIAKKYSECDQGGQK